MSYRHYLKVTTSLGAEVFSGATKAEVMRAIGIINSSDFNGHAELVSSLDPLVMRRKRQERKWSDYYRILPVCACPEFVISN